MSKRSVMVHANLAYDAATLEDAQAVVTSLLGQLHVEAERIGAEPIWDTLNISTEEYHEESRSICDAANVRHEWKVFKASVQSTRDARPSDSLPQPAIDHWVDYQ